MGLDRIPKKDLALPQFIVTNLNTFSNEPFKIEGEEAKHILFSRRLKKGQNIRLADGKGNVLIAEIVETDKSSLLVKPVKGPFFKDDLIPVSILLSITKSERFDFSISKLSEIGIKEIFPVFTKRSLLTNREESRLKHKFVRWNKLSLESLKQSRGFKATKIFFPRDLKDALNELKKDEFHEKLILYEEEDKEDLSFLRPFKDRSYLVAVGPEGGFDDEDLELFKNNGFKPIKLAERILRSETAAIFIASLISHFYKIGKASKQYG